MGEVKICLGCMWASKTTWLISEIEKAQIVDRKILVILYSHDDRYSNKSLVAHNGKIFSGEHILRVEKLTDDDCKDIASKYNFVAIDEAQFIKNVANAASKLADLGCDVVVTCLNGDFKQEPFPEIIKLISVSDKIHHSRAICMECKKNKASFTHRTSPNVDQVAIGGKDMYKVLCRSCLNVVRAKA